MLRSGGGGGAGPAECARPFACWWRHILCLRSTPSAPLCAIVDVVAIMTVPTPLLDTINSPADLRRLDERQLPQLADELRVETVNAVAVTGGHLGAGLGVVELTVALHYLFDTPRDRVIWDVGHQAYPHKILTSRRDRIRTLRQGGGLSGFTKRAE